MSGAKIHQFLQLLLKQQRTQGSVSRKTFSPEHISVRRTASLSITHFWHVMVFISCFCLWFRSPS